MRLLLIALFATLLLAAPASAARFQHNGPDIDFTTGCDRHRPHHRHRPRARRPEQLTFTRGTGRDRVHRSAPAARSRSASRAAASATRRACASRPTSGADLIDASRTDDAVRRERAARSSTPRAATTSSIAGPLADEVRRRGRRRLDHRRAGRGLAGGEAATTCSSGSARATSSTAATAPTCSTCSGEVAGHDDLAQRHRRRRAARVAAPTCSAIETVMRHARATTSSPAATAPRRSRAATATTGSTRAAAAPTPSICGPGAADVAIVDETDSVTGCERVELPTVGRRSPPVRPTPSRRRRSPWSTSTATASWRASTATTPAPRSAPAPATCRATSVDEDCAGGDARASQVGGRLSFDFTAFPNGTTRVDRLRRPRAPGRRARGAALRGPLRLPQEGRQGARREGQPPQADPRPPAHRRDARGPADRRPGRSAAWSASRCARRGCPKRTSLCLPPGGKVGPLRLT